MIVMNDFLVPKECVSEIISYLSTQDIGKASMVAKSFNAIASADRIWHSIISRECPKLMIPLHPQGPTDTAKENFIKINRAIIDTVIKSAEKNVSTERWKFTQIFSKSLVESVKSSDICHFKKVKLIQNELNFATCPLLPRISQWPGKMSNLESLKTLLMVGADPNIQNSASLRFAVAAGGVEAVQLLLESGADPMREDQGGKKALDKIEISKGTEAQKESMKKLLIQYSAQAVHNEQV